MMRLSKFEIAQEKFQSNVARYRAVGRAARLMRAAGLADLAAEVRDDAMNDAVDSVCTMGILDCSEFDSFWEGHGRVDSKLFFSRLVRRVEGMLASGKYHISRTERRRRLRRSRAVREAHTPAKAGEGGAMREVVRLGPDAPDGTVSR